MILDVQCHIAAGHPEYEAVRQAIIERLSGQFISALVRRATCIRKQATKRRVTVPVACQGHELAATAELQLRTDNEFFQAMRFRGRVGAHDARHRTLVRNRQRLVAECRSGFDEFLGMGSTAQEGEVTERM